jgi:Aspartyl protease
MDALATQSGGRIDGILGMDVIERWAIEINYAAGTLRLHAPGSYRCPNGCTAIPWVQEGGEWFVTGRVMAAGRPPVAGRFRLDTGSGGALALTRPFVEAHDLLAATPGTVDGTAVGIGGMSRRRVGRLAALSIGPFVIEQPVTAFAQDSVGEMARADLAGVIGADILRRFRLVLDAQSQRVLVLEYRPDPPLAHNPERAYGQFGTGPPNRADRRTVPSATGYPRPL